MSDDTITIPSLTEGVTPDVRPQDDLFGHINGAWLETAEIPGDRSAWGSFDMLGDQAELNVHRIITEAADANGEQGSDEQRIGDLFRSFMDVEEIAARGLTPITSIFDRIDTVTDPAGFMTLAGSLAREGITGPVALGVWVDRGNSTRYLIHLSQAGLGLPDEAYYRSEEHREAREAYPGHIAEMLTLVERAPRDSAAAIAAEIVELETKIAAAHWERSAVRDTVATYNLTSAEELAELFPHAADWMEGAGVPPSAWQEVVVGQPDVVERIAGLLESEDLETWKRWLSWTVTRSLAGFLPEPIVAANFEFYGRVLRGTEELRPRWKRGVALVEALLGELVGRQYVERHYPKAAREQMDTMIEYLMAAYEQRISELEWMQPGTRAKALAKLASFTPKVGFPVKWKTYPGLEIDPNDLIGNLRAAHAAESDRLIAQLDGPVDRDEWFMTPQSVNAYYNATMNEIVFPAAILQPPFFDPERDPAYNYGGIGAVIGHEIGHGFDDQGSKYDGEGNLKNWWSDADREAFEERVEMLVDQFDTLSPRNLGSEHTVNGRLTVGENIGDIGGAAVAHHAYRMFIDAECDGDSPIIDGMTGDQRFFAGWASAWRWLGRDREAIRRLATDPHAPPEFRANVVRNVDAFHEAFETKPGDGMWLEPEDRVHIW